MFHALLPEAHLNCKGTAEGAKGPEGSGGASGGAEVSGPAVRPAPAVRGGRGRGEEIERSLYLVRIAGNNRDKSEPNGDINLTV